MIRLAVAAAILVIGTVSFAAQPKAQSPNPALLAPGQSRRMLAPPVYKGRSSYPAAGRIH
jgi:hypothetical protein